MIFFAMLFSIDLVFPQQEDIRLQVYGKTTQNHKAVFLAPHENEHVVNEYLAGKVAREGGRFLALRQNGERHIKLALGNGRHAEVDPNRIFTRKGARSSLKKLNPELMEDSSEFKKACERAMALGAFIIEQMEVPPRGGVIVAIHNNTDGYDDDGKGGEGTISMVRYQQRFEAGARYIKALHHGDGDEDDLFFITHASDFEAMKRAGWNVVLQHPRVASIPDEDDGSLSVYSEMNDIRYINIEAQRKKDDDHLEIQIQMVDLVFKLIQD